MTLSRLDHTLHPPKVVMLHGLPRSGTSLLGMLLSAHPDVRYRYQPLDSYLNRHELDRFLGHEGLEDLRRELISCRDPFIMQTRLEDEGTHIQSFTHHEAPTMVIKHVGYHNHLLEWMRHPHALLVIINRKSEDIIASQLRAHSELGQYGFGEEVWRTATYKNGENPNSYYGFSKILQFRKIQGELTKKFSQRIKIVNYEKLLGEPIGVVEEIIDFLRLPVAGQVRCLVDFMQSTTPSKSRSDYNKLRAIESREADDDNEIKKIKSIIISEELELLKK